MSRVLTHVLLAASLPMPALAALDAPLPSVVALDVHEFRPVEGPSSGPEVYYRVVDGQDGSELRGMYQPGMQSVTMGIDIPEQLRGRALLVRWEWRARVVPERGDECIPGRGDSAASVSLAFKRGMKWYILKYVWSGASPLGEVCDRKRSLLVARDTIVLERGDARETWVREVVDVRRAFIDHFAGGDLGADVPDLVGIGVMSDGDQTWSPSGADWTGFELVTNHDSLDGAQSHRRAVQREGQAPPRFPDTPGGARRPAPNGAADVRRAVSAGP